MKTLNSIAYTLSFLLLCIACQNNSISKNQNTDQIDKIKGVCWVANDSIVLENFNSLQHLHANWISQTPFGWQRHHNSPEIAFGGQDVFWGERDAGLSHTANLARKVGIKTILKPHIWLTRPNGKWRSDIAMDSAEEWELWFENYHKFILHYARLAEKQQIPMLCIGTELYQSTVKHPEQWRGIIKEIRKIYSGQLTYAANFYKEFEEITFWDDLDFIGIQAYFPLTKKENPSLTLLKEGWQDQIPKLKVISDQYRKPILFTEVGYKNSSDAAIEPWVWPRQMDLDKVKLSDETQANCYEALFQSLWEEDWFGGVFIWKWFHATYRYNDKVYHAKMKALKDSLIQENEVLSFGQFRFSPQGRPAEKIIQKWFLQGNN